jgi:hypothetical protein
MKKSMVIIFASLAIAGVCLAQKSLNAMDCSQGLHSFVVVLIDEEIRAFSTINK